MRKLLMKCQLETKNTTSESKRILNSIFNDKESVDSVKNRKLILK